MGYSPTIAIDCLMGGNFMNRAIGACATWRGPVRRSEYVGVVDDDNGYSRASAATRFKLLTKGPNRQVAMGLLAA